MPWKEEILVEELSRTTQETEKPIDLCLSKAGLNVY